MTDETKKEADDLLDQLLDISYELSELSSRSQWLEDKVDESCYMLKDFCRELHIDIDEEEEDAE